MRKLLVLLLMLAFCAASAQAANLLLNPGFETDPFAVDGNEDPIDWWTWVNDSWASTDATWESSGGDEGSSYEGSKFIRIYGGTDLDSWSEIQLGIDVEATAGTQYHLGVMAKDSSDATEGVFGVIIRWIDTNGDWISESLFVEELTTSEWQQFTYGPVPPSVLHTADDYDTDGLLSPAGTVAVQILFENWAGIWADNPLDGLVSESPHPGVCLDNVWFSTDTMPPARPVLSPVPGDGETIAAGALTLEWTRDENWRSGGGAPEVEIYWGDGDANAANFWTGDVPLGIDAAVKIMDQADADSLDLSTVATTEYPSGIDILVGNDYKWAAKYQEETGTAMVEGAVWSFDTNNKAPIAEAGYNDSVFLADAGPYTVQLNGSHTDDGFPVGGTVRYTWTCDDAAVTFSDANDPDAVATFVGLGIKTITLTVEDDYLDVSGGQGKSDTDTTQTFVFGDTFAQELAHWSFDADMTDDFASHDGTAVGDAQITTSDSQLGGGALLLDGDGDYVEIADSGTTDPNNTTWASPAIKDWLTVTAWIKGANAQNAWAGIVHKGAADNNDPDEVAHDAWQLQIEGGSDDVQFKPGNAGDAVATSDDIANGASVDNVLDDKWHQIAGVLFRDRVYLYIDGILADVEDWDPTDITTGGAPIRIGGASVHSDPSADQAFTGLIDEVHIYRVPYNAAKILELFKAEEGKNSCGGEYDATDVNKDCYHNLADLAEIAKNWLTCSDVTNPICD